MTRPAATIGCGLVGLIAVAGGIPIAAFVFIVLLFGGGYNAYTITAVVLLAGAVMITAGLVAAHGIRKARPVDRVTCVRCAYDLRGFDGPRCPECGLLLPAIPPDAPGVERPARADAAYLRRVAAGLCPRCGYDTGSPGVIARCPECGHDWTEALPFAGFTGTPGYQGVTPPPPSAPG